MDYFYSRELHVTGHPGAGRLDDVSAARATGSIAGTR